MSSGRLRHQHPTTWEAPTSLILEPSRSPALFDPCQWGCRFGYKLDTYTWISHCDSYIYPNSTPGSFGNSAIMAMAGLKTIIALSFVRSLPPPNSLRRLTRHGFTNYLRRSSQSVFSWLSSRPRFGTSTGRCWWSPSTSLRRYPIGSVGDARTQMTSWIARVIRLWTLDVS